MKKWTYLVAILAMVFATPVFTGCIDNEEPAGIEELRTAKAELLRAKAAVEAAKVAQEEAKALQEQAKAKQEEALAAYRAAEAALKQAEADSVAAKAEAAAALAAAQLETALMEEKAALAEAQAAYEAALKNLELAKVALTDEQKAYLAPYIAIYNEAVTALETALGDVDSKADALADAITAQDENEAKKSYLRQEKKDLAEAQAAYDAAVKAEALAKAAAEATPDAAALDAKLKELNDSLEVLRKDSASYEVEWAQLVAETEEEWNTIKDSIDYYIALTGYKHDYNQATVTRVAVEYDDYGFELEDGERVLSTTGSTEDMPMAPVLIKSSYLDFADLLSLANSEYTFQYSAYLQALKDDTEFTTNKGGVLNGLMATAKTLVRDENDNAWTTERIAEKKAELATAEEYFNGYKEVWQNLVDIYTSGAAWADPSSLEGFEDVEAAVAAYNEAADAYNAANIAYLKAEKELAALLGNVTNEAYKAKKDSIETAYNEAVAEANATVNALQAELNDKEATLQQAVETQQAIVNRLQAEYNLLMVTDTTAAKAKLAEYEAALEAKLDADTLYMEFVLEPTQHYPSVKDSIFAEASDISNKIIAVEVAKKAEAEAKLAEEFFQSNTDSYNVYITLADAKNKAENALNEAIGDVNNAKDAFKLDNNLWSIQDYDNKFNEAAYNSEEIVEGYEELVDENSYTWMPLTIEDAASVVALSKTEIEDAIKSQSEIVFGLQYGYTSHNYYLENLARLIDLTAEEAKADAAEAALRDMKNTYNWANMTLSQREIFEAIFEANKDYYANAYIHAGNFGVFGSVLQFQLKIEKMENWLNNAEVIEALIADIQAAIDGIDDDIAAATAMVEAAEKSFTKLYDAYAAKFEDLDAKFEAIDAAKDVLEPVITSIENAIEVYLGYEEYSPVYFGFETQSQALEFKDKFEHATLLQYVINNEYIVNVAKVASIDELKIVLEKIYADAQEATYVAETALINAEETLQTAIDTDLDVVAAAEEDLKEAQEELEEAQAELAEAQKALEAALALIGEGDLSADDAAMQAQP